MKRFHDSCKTFGLKQTPQRMAVYQEVVPCKDHPSADMIFRRVRLKIPSISLDTVNRTLIDFAKAGLIHPVECSEKARQYEPNLAPHHHLKCLSCGMILDFYHRAFDNLPIPKGIHKGFKIAQKRVVFLGLCADCQRAKRPKSNRLTSSKRRTS